MLSSADDPVRAMGKIYRATNAYPNSKIPGLFVDDIIGTAYMRVDWKVGNVVNIFYEGGAISSSAKTSLSNGLKSALEGITPSGKVDEAVEAIFKKLEGRTFSNEDEAISFIRKEIEANLDDSIVRKAIAVDVGELTQFSKRLKTVAYEKFINSVLDGNNFKESVEIAAKSSGALKKINPMDFKKALGQIDDISSGIINPQTGVVSWDRLIGTNYDELLKKTNDDVLSRLFEQMSDNNVRVQLDSFSDLFNGRKVGKGIYEGVMQQAGFKGVGIEKLKSFAKLQLQGLGCLAVVPGAALTALGGGLTVGATATRIAPQTTWAATKSFGGLTFNSLEGCGSWVRQYMLPILLVLGYSFRYQDSINEKYLPAGENTLALNTPNWIAEEPIKYPLDIGLKYVSMYRDKSQEPTKLSLASPCKTDLIVEKKACSGKIYDGDFVLRYTEKYNGEDRVYLQPVKQLALKKDAINYKYYGWDHATEQEKIGLLNTPPNTPWAFFSYMDVKKKSVKLMKNNEDLAKEAILLMFENHVEEFIKTIVNLTDPDISAYSAQQRLKFACFDEFSEDKDSQTKVCLGQELKNSIGNFAEQLKQNKGYFENNKQEFNRFLEIFAINSTDYQPLYFKANSIINVNAETIRLTVAYLLASISAFTRYEKIAESDINLEDFYSATNPRIGFYGDLLKLYQKQENKPSFMERVVRESVYSYYVFDINDVVDKDSLVKEFKKGIDSTGKFSSGMAVVENPFTLVNNGPLVTTSTVPCITIKTYADDNIYHYEHNFCYYGENAALKMTEQVLIWGSVIVSIAAAPFTAGQSLWITAAVAATDLGAAGAGYWLKAERKWPNHQP